MKLCMLAGFTAGTTLLQYKVCQGHSLWSLVKAVINRAVASQGLEMHQPALPHSNHTQSGGGVHEFQMQPGSV